MSFCGNVSFFICMSLLRFRECLIWQTLYALKALDSSCFCMEVNGKGYDWFIFREESKGQTMDGIIRLLKCSQQRWVRALCCEYDHLFRISCRRGEYLMEGITSFCFIVSNEEKVNKDNPLRSIHVVISVSFLSCLSMV